MGPFWQHACVLQFDAIFKDEKPVHEEVSVEVRNDANLPKRVLCDDVEGHDEERLNEWYTLEELL
jgi:hypothetical protein